MAIAPAITHAIEKAINLVMKPRINNIEPTLSVIITRKTNMGEIPILDDNPSIVAEKPLPPNQPKSFWAPCGKITPPRVRRNSVAE